MRKLFDVLPKRAKPQECDGVNSGLSPCMQGEELRCVLFALIAIAGLVAVAFFGVKLPIVNSGLELTSAERLLGMFCGLMAAQFGTSFLWLEFFLTERHSLTVAASLVLAGIFGVFTIILTDAIRSGVLIF